jgi:hypothetical protein
VAEDRCASARLLLPADCFCLRQSCVVGFLRNAEARTVVLPPTRRGA